MVEGSFRAFRSSLDDDIQSFIHEKAIYFERRGWSSVYLLFNEEYFTRGKLKLEAFFTLSHKALSVSDEVSKSMKKVIFKGISPNDTLVHFVLIGHLGKHLSDDYVSEITSREIIDAAFEIIGRSNELITCYTLFRSNR